MNILVVDNEEAMLETLKRGLTVKGFNVFGALTGVKALETLENFEIDMVITDYSMPRMTGLELTKKIKETKDIPIILMTADGNQNLMEEAKFFNCAGFLYKPFTLKNLMDEISPADRV